MTSIQPGGAAGLPMIPEHQVKVPNVADIAIPDTSATPAPPRAHPGMEVDAAQMRRVKPEDGPPAWAHPVQVADGEGLIQTAKRVYGRYPTPDEIAELQRLNPTIRPPAYVVPKDAVINVPATEAQVAAKLDELVGGALAGAGAGALAGAGAAMAGAQQQAAQAAAAHAEAEKQLTPEVRDLLAGWNLTSYGHIGRVKDAIYQARTAADFQAIAARVDREDGFVAPFVPAIDRLAAVQDPAVREALAEAVGHKLGGVGDAGVDAALQAAWDQCRTAQDREAVRQVAAALGSAVVFPA